MKSYFAKLAARATLANAPPPPSTSKPTPDPFENVSTPDLPPPTVSINSGPVDRLLETDRAEPPGKINNTSPSNPTDADTRIESETFRPTLTPPVARADYVQSVSDNTAEVEERRTKSETQPQGLRLEFEERTAFEPVQEESTLKPRASVVPTEVKKSDKTDELNTVERLEEIQSEQAALLRKADTFMNVLFDRGTDAKTTEANKDQERAAPSVKREIVREPSSRLQPVVKPHQLPEIPAEQPSLVIGKLTVEVMPAPQPVAPTRQVVVVRGGESSRRSSIHSSQRFGLGQF
jgi:hypothetical protein